MRHRVVALGTVALLPLAACACALTAPAPNGVTIRVARPHQLGAVAQLQLDTFAPLPEPPPLLPMLQQLFESNQRKSRALMLKRLTNELQNRVSKGSDILVAVQEELEVEQPTVFSSCLLYTSPSPRDS